MELQDPLKLIKIDTGPKYGDNLEDDVITDSEIQEENLVVTDQVKIDKFVQIRVSKITESSPQ